MLRPADYLPAATLHLLLVISNLLMQAYCYRPNATAPEVAKGLPALILCMGHAVLLFLAPTQSAAVERAVLSAPRRLAAQLTAVPGGEGWDCYAAVLTAIHFFGVGMLEYSYTMFKACTGGTAKKTDLTVCSMHESGPYDEQMVERLTFLEGLYFAVVITTTVGYGHVFTPASPAGRAFTMYYSISGLVIFALATAHFGKLFDGLAVRARGMVARMRDASMGAVGAVAPEPTPEPAESAGNAGVAAEGDAGKALDPAKAASTLDPTAHLPIEVAAHYEQSSIVFVLFVKFVAVNFACAAIFVALEPDWGLQDAIYHCMMTASTVGLGDIGPTTPRSRAFSIFHMLVSVVLFGSLIGTVTEVQHVAARSKERKRMLNRTLDKDLVLNLDHSGDGKLDKSEFALGMLLRLGVVTEADVKPFFARFDELDADRSGTLDSADLATHFTDAVAKAAAAKQAEYDELRDVYSLCKKLAVCSGIGCLNFLWTTVFGFAMMLGGFLGALTVRYTMRVKLDAYRLRNAALLAALTTAAWVATAVLWFMWIVPQATVDYYLMDRFAAAMFYGRLRESRFTTLDGATVDFMRSDVGKAFLVRAHEQVLADAPSWALQIGLMTTYMLYVVAVGVRTVLALQRAHGRARAAARG